jgi:putative ATPase
MSDFFENDNFVEINRPLAYRIRPKKLEDFRGQKHLLDEKKVLRKIIESQKLCNMIFYGPSGSGKTALVKIISNEMNLPVTEINATISGVMELKKILVSAQQVNERYKKNMLVMIDELHHFNKTQQDVLLPSIENGSIILIGLTTENPYFYVNNAILSRSMVFEFKKLDKADIIAILNRALKIESGTNEDNQKICEDEVLEYIASFTNGDARYSLNILDTILATIKPSPIIKLEDVKNNFDDILKVKINYDKKYDSHYDIISAFIKSLRGSDPDAALYWLALMLESGEDIRFIARRIAISASEDVGLAYPNILTIVKSGWDLVEKIGMPEARIILAEMVVLVATSPKSNSAYLGIDKAISDIRNGNIQEVPNHLKDATNDKVLGHGKNYKYPHDFKNHFVNQNYLNDGYKAKYYYPTNEGQEKLYKNFLFKLWDIKDEK